MKHTTFVIVAGLAMVAAMAGAGQTVVHADGTTALDVLTVPTNAGVWVRTGPGEPLLVQADEAGTLQLPALATAHNVVLDAATNEPVATGNLVWEIADAPRELTAASWTSSDGNLDLLCTGAERLTVSAPGYGSTTLTPQLDGRRHPVLLQPRGDLTIELQPATEARMWLARQDQINVTSLFINVAEKYRIDAPGVIEVQDLDREAAYVGIIVAQGKVPVVGSFQGLPLDQKLPLEDGMTVGGSVRDADGNPLAGASIEAMGEISELDSFRYRQFATTDAEGAFSVGGLLPGAIRVRACAPGRACTEAAIEIAADTVTTPVSLELAPGRDIVLVVKNEVNTPAADAMLYFKDRLHVADHRGQLAVQGVAQGETIPVKIFGEGFGMWEGSFTADRAQVVIVVPGGAVIEQQVLSARRFASDEVKVRWQAYDPQGRETRSGKGTWDAEVGVARVTGLEAGTYCTVGPPSRCGHHRQRAGRSFSDRAGRPARRRAGARSRHRRSNSRCRHAATRPRGRGELRTGVALGISRPRHRPGRALGVDRYRRTLSARGSRRRAVQGSGSRRRFCYLAARRGRA